MTHPAQPAPPAAIVLGAVNARYSHTAFGARWIWANMGPLQSQCLLREFTLRDAAADVAAGILRHNPRIVGLGAYIWNVERVTEAARHIRAQAPDVLLVIGGPEVSYEFEKTPLFDLADYLVRGEGEQAFPALAEKLLAGGAPPGKVIDGVYARLEELALPYTYYTGDDIAHRLIYVESSRGCPFRCVFCLSSLEQGMRFFEVETFLAEMERLLVRGARQFKFVDRTFNIRPERAERILRFFLERIRPGLRLHFEVVPDRLPQRLLEAMAAFPAGALHLEIGVQTYNPDSQAAICRRQDLAATEATLDFLRNCTGADLHADLVAGLPHETWGSFAAGFDRLYAHRPQAIQVGILKRLKGTQLAAMPGLRFENTPPYAVRETDWMTAAEIAAVQRFAAYWDRFYNRGRFTHAVPLLLDAAGSPFAAFHTFSGALHLRHGTTHHLPLKALAESLYLQLVSTGIEETRAREAIEADYHDRPGRRDRLTLNPAEAT